MNKRQNRVWLAVVAVLILVCIVLCGGLLFLESAVLLPPEDAVVTVPSKTVTRNSIDYFPRQDITVILLMGIDEPGPVRDSLSYNNEGEADMVALVIIDEATEEYRILALNRDTMMEIPVLGLGGKQAGTRVAQLALAHAYGTGLEDSCVNTRNAVSGFLMNVPIDYYISMNMDAVAILNDAVGGVTVNITEDFSLVNEEIGRGEVTLQGEQALSFVQMRKDVGDHLNLSRMERQKEYMQGFVRAFREKTDKTENFVLSTYEAVAPYLVSDLPVSTLSAMVERYEGYTIAEIVTPAGDNVLGDEYYEFYPDEKKLEELILRLFYAPKK